MAVIWTEKNGMYFYYLNNLYANLLNYIYAKTRWENIKKKPWIQLHLHDATVLLVTKTHGVKRVARLQMTEMPCEHILLPTWNQFH